MKFFIIKNFMLKNIKFNRQNCEICWYLILGKKEISFERTQLKLLSF